MYICSGRHVKAKGLASRRSRYAAWQYAILEYFQIARLERRQSIVYQPPPT